MSSTEKRQSLKHATTYQAVNGIAMCPGCFSCGWILQREILLSSPATPFFVTTPPSTADLSKVWSPSCNFYITFSIHVRQRD